MAERQSMKTQHYTETDKAYNFPQQGDLACPPNHACPPSEVCKVCPPQQVSSSMSRQTKEQSSVKGTNIETQFAQAPVPSNVALHQTEVKTQTVGQQHVQNQQITKPVVPEQHYIHKVENQPQVVEVAPEQRVEIKKKTVNINDHGLQERMQQSAAGLNEYMETLQTEANLLAQEKANKQVLQQVSQTVCDTSRQRQELDQQAGLREAEALHKLKEAEVAAKQMMADAKSQVKQVEAQQKQGGVVTERISEVRTKTNNSHSARS